MIRLIDIEKELRNIRTEFKPDERLRQRTRSLVISEAGKRNRSKTDFKKAAFKFSPAVAFVLVLVLCISLFTSAPARAAGYYTIDIDSSISVAVDQNDTVISVSAEDDEAAALLEGLDIDGMQFEDALKVIVQAAAQKDYLKEDGHVLVAHFGDGEGISQEDVNTIVDGQLPADKVSALALNGSADDYKNAKKSGKKAGIELLLNSADAAGIEEKDPDTVISIMSDKANKADKSYKDSKKDKEKDKDKDKDKDKNQDKDKGKDKDKDKDGTYNEDGSTDKDD
jgi:hypothetical protein